MNRDSLSRLVYARDLAGLPSKRSGITGFRLSQRKAADRIEIGDSLLCYLVKLQRWVGILEVKSLAFEDHTPISASEDDPAAAVQFTSAVGRRFGFAGDFRDMDVFMNDFGRHEWQSSSHCVQG